jgi:hypothetical protein
MLNFNKMNTKITNIRFMLVILIASILGSCDSPFDLNVDQAPTKVVIEGLITNELKQHYVRVSTTKEYGKSGTSPIVKNAIVEVADNQGNTFTFTHNETGESDIDGYYFSPVFAGNIGSIYTMTVQLDGNSYSGSDKLLRVTSVDSLSVKINEDLRDVAPEDLPDDIDPDEFYEVFFIAKEPQETKDYYLFKYYKNGEVLKDSDTEISFAEDTFVGEDIHDIATAGFFALEDSATVEFYSLTRKGFVYYTDMYNVLNNDGGMFGAVPSNPRTNLTGGALGYFQTSAVTRRSIIVKDPG